MFFVFASGCPQDGECAGGLDDMKAKAATLAKAKEIGAILQSTCYDVEILDGATGAIWDYTARMEWEERVPEVTGWRDMGTAPKSGERFLATDGKVVSIVRHGSMEMHRHADGKVVLWVYDGAEIECSAYGPPDPVVDVFELTGWQPLPKP